MSDEIKVGNIYGVKVMRPTQCVKLVMSNPGYVERYGPALGWTLVYLHRAWDAILPPLLFALSFTCFLVAARAMFR